MSLTAEQKKRLLKAKIAPPGGLVDFLAIGIP
jgi:hypothetical protein